MPSPLQWRLRTRSLSLERPLIMGVVNVTPDSFSDGGLFSSADEAVAHGRRLFDEGADLIDVGGESTRPGSEPVDEQTEKNRVVPVVEALTEIGAVVSIDTTKANVASAAITAGAEVVNDVTAGSDPGMFDLVASSGAGMVLMHMKGTPRTMQEDPRYDDVVAEIADFLLERAAAAETAGIGREALVIDPGIGFGKTVEHNLELIRRLGVLVSTGYPVMVGASRKGFLGKITGIDVPARRDVATAAVTALAVSSGAAVVRVHDVVSSREAAAVAWAVSRVQI